MKINWKTLLICIAIPLAAGGVSALISMGGMQTYNAFVQPPLAPPGWLFPVVWTVLYILMGVASYLVYTAEAPNVQIEGALKVYALQLFFNFCWSIIFFGFGLYWFALIWLLALWALIIWCIVLFSRISNTAAYLMIPYLVWVTFAAYLNAGVAALN